MKIPNQAETATHPPTGHSQDLAGPTAPVTVSACWNRTSPEAVDPGCGKDRQTTS